MKKRFVTLIALFIALLVAGPACAEFQDMWASVYKLTDKNLGDSALTEITSGITYKVLQRNSTTAETLYVFGSGTTLTNPVSTTNYALATSGQGKVRFRVDPGETGDRYVDLLVTDTNGGFSVFVEDFDRYNHKIVIDERPNVEHIGCIPFSSVSNGSLTNTGVTFLPQTVVRDVFVEIVTADSGNTVNIGTALDSDAFRAAVLATTTGFVHDTGIVTNGVNVDYYPAANYGTLLTTAITGADTSSGSGGGNSRKPHFVTAATSNLNSLYFDGTATSAAGYIYYLITRLR